MATLTKIDQLPGNWEIWEGSEAWPEWEEMIGPVVAELLGKRFPGGEIICVGDEIWGPATIKHGPAYDDRRHCWRFERDTPEPSEIEGIEILDRDDWLMDLYEEAGEIVRDRLEEDQHATAE